MNCASTNPRGQRPSLRPCAAGRRRGFTFLEMLVALTIAMAFMSGVYVTFIQIIRAHDVSSARADAVSNARAAMTSLSDEIKGISSIGSDVLLVGLNSGITSGDGIDNDGNNGIDEEVVDGVNNDSDAAVGSDRHATIQTAVERPQGQGRDDLGDSTVDEDVRFGRDTIIFRIYPTVPTPELRVKTVTYGIATFDGQPNVLVRQTRIERDTGEPLIGVAPIAFGVLGFDLLYWNPNAAPAQQGWVTSWDSDRILPDPDIRLPASVYIRLTMYADRLPVETYTAGKPVETLILDSMVNIEQTINSALYPRRII